MNIVPLPFVYGYMFVPPYYCCDTLPQPPKKEPRVLREDEYLTLQETENELQDFLLTVQHLAHQKADITYMELNDKKCPQILPGISQFQQIYRSGLLKYKLSYKKGEKKKKSWGQDDIQVFLWVLDKYCRIWNKAPKDMTELEWAQVAQLVPFRSGADCMFKWLSLKKNRLDTHPWTPQEEEYLLELGRIQLKNSATKEWVRISRLLYKSCPQVYRSPKQCRERWTLYINSVHDRANGVSPDLGRKLWTVDEDRKLMESFLEHGRRWKSISRHLQGRSENAIKNRFTLLIQKYSAYADRMQTSERAQVLNVIKVLKSGEMPQLPTETSIKVSEEAEADEKDSESSQEV